MSENNEIINIQYEAGQWSPIAIGEDLASLSPKPYIPFYSLLLNENVNFPYPEQRTGWLERAHQQDTTKVLLKVRKHPMFIPVRKAEEAIRQNELSFLQPENFYAEIEDDYTQIYENNIDLNGNSLFVGLLNLAITYRNTEAVRLLLDSYPINPNSGLVAAIVEQNMAMIKILVDAGANINEVLPETNQYPLHTAIVQPKPSLTLVKLILRLGGDKTIKNDETGNNAFSYALKANKKYKQKITDILNQENYDLSLEERRELGEEQIPDNKYLTSSLEQVSNDLYQAFNNRSKMNELLQVLILNASSQALKIITNIYRYALTKNKSRTTRLLLDAIFHENLCVPENDWIYLDVYSISNKRTQRKLIDFLYDLNTEKLSGVFSAIIKSNANGVLNRLRNGLPPYKEEQIIFYSSDEKIVDNNDTSINMMPCMDYNDAFESAKEFYTRSHYLKDQTKYLPKDEQISLIRSIIQEARTDLSDKENGLWCFYKNAHELRSDDWHDVVHIPSIIAVSWLIYLVTKKPEWCKDVFKDNLYISASPITYSVYENVAYWDASEESYQAALLQMIRIILIRLTEFKLVSRRHGGIFTIDAMEFLVSAGLYDFLNENNVPEFREVIENRIRKYKRQYNENRCIVVEGVQNVIGDIYCRGDVDVTDRFKDITTKFESFSLADIAQGKT